MRIFLQDDEVKKTLLSREYANYNGVSYGSYGKNYSNLNSAEAFAINKTAALDQLEQQKETYFEESKLLESYINLLTVQEQQVVSLVCIEGHNAIYAAQQLNMDKSTVYRLKNEALNKLTKWIYLR